jgi:hypothetical protein
MGSQRRGVEKQEAKDEYKKKEGRVQEGDSREEEGTETGG